MGNHFGWIEFGFPLTGLEWPLFLSAIAFTAEFVPLAVANRIPALTTGRVRILLASMAMPPDRAKALQFSKPFVANIISLIAPKTATVKTNADMKNFVIGVARSSVQDTMITTGAPEGTTIRRFDAAVATMQALLSGQVEAVGGNMFYVQRLSASKPGTFEDKLEFTRLYNGACTCLGDKEMNAAANAFVEQIRGNGELATAYAKWMKVPVPNSGPALTGFILCATWPILLQEIEMMRRYSHRLRKSIATVALSGTLVDKPEAAATVGFDGVEIMESDRLSFDGSREDVRRMAAELGLAIDIYQPFRDFEAMPEPQRGRNMDRAERKFDVMQALGTDLLLVCSNTLAGAVDDDARAAADLAEMAKRAARRGPRVGYEALCWGRHVRLWSHAWRIVPQVYLVARDVPGASFWQNDFNLLPMEADDGRLTATDHVAMALPVGWMDMFVLFWRAPFGLEPQPIWDLPDPYGLIHSRAMVSPNGSVRRTFNVSEARETATNRFVSAFARSNAAASAARLEHSGATKLAIPANYYEDVAARFSQDGDTAAELERSGLIYDRDARGEFRHAYTVPFQDRFFFEIAELRDGYAGFGAANAAVRMAAQARRLPPQF